MKKILNLLAATAAALLCLPPAGLRAQQFNTNPVELPSSTVWQQMKYNNVAGASLYTGTVNISIPLYDYQDGEMAIPISLGYSANGYQPNIQSGIVGHDWALNAGGAITRTVRGLPDEASNNSRYGFLETFYDTSISSVFELTGFTTAMDSYWIGATTPRIYYSRYGFYNPSILMDTEPDIFYFNFLGYSGKFQLGYDGLIHVYDTNTRSEEFKVEVPRYNLDEIVIITGDGTRYTFGTGNALEDDTSYGTAWKLASISTQSGRSATFSYVTQARQYNVLLYLCTLLQLLLILRECRSGIRHRHRFHTPGIRPFQGCLRPLYPGFRPRCHLSRQWLRHRILLQEPRTI